MQNFYKVLLGCLFLVNVWAFNDGVQELRAEIKTENDCIAAADGKDELQKCFDMMRENNRD